MSYPVVLYPIEPKITKTVITTYNKYTINNLTITPFVNATMIIQMFSEREPNEIYSQFLCMEGEAYNMWEGDDAYLINWVNQQLQSIQ